MERNEKLRKNYMKFYIQNGFNKQLIIETSEKSAIQKMINSLLTTDKDGNELAEFAPLTYVSTYGFAADMIELNLFDKLDEMQIYRTDSILESLKRPDIAKHIRKQVQKGLPDVQKLFKISLKLV